MGLRIECAKWDKFCNNVNFIRSGTKTSFAKKLRKGAFSCDSRHEVLAETFFAPETERLLLLEECSR